MRKHIITLAILAASAAAHATYGGPGEPPYPPGEGPQQPAATVPSSTNTSGANAGAQSASRSAADSASSSRATGGNAQGGNARQGQAQGQSSRNSQRSAQSATMAGGAVTVDAADRSSSRIDARTVFIPAIVPPTPPSNLAVGGIVQSVSNCGPLVTVVKRGVQGTFVGLTSDSYVDQGSDDELMPYYDPETGMPETYKRFPLPGGGWQVFGHQVTQYAAIVGVAGARNIALGGGSSSGGWAQGGGGASSSMQRVVSKIVVRLCHVGDERPEPEVRYMPPRRADRR